MTQPERRDQRRVPLDREYTVSFTLGGEPFDRLPTPNVSAGGMCVMVPSEKARHFQRGAVLEGIVLNHPALPKDVLRGEVRYTLGGGHLASMRHVGVGVMFLDPPTGVVEALNAFVRGHFGEI
jgi:hypothetical protein